jgi:hypothetical protein
MGLRDAAHWLARDVPRSLARFRNVPPAAIAGLYWRAMTIGGSTPAPRTTAPRAERIVVSLSTIPSRTAHLRPVLHSLLDQTEPADRIVLALPQFSAREGRAYPPVAALDLPAGIEVLACDDLGPATKLLPALAAEPAAAIVVVDDDVVYPRDFIATLLAAHRQQPAAAVGYRGVRLKAGTPFVDLEHRFGSAVAAPTPVDVLFGTWGYLIPPGALDGAVHDLVAHPEHLRWVDDIWISGHLARRGVGRLVVPARSIPIETANARRAALTDGPNRSGENDRRAIEMFAADW